MDALAATFTDAGITRFSMAADKLDPNVVFIGGLAQPQPFPAGVRNANGIILRGDITRPKGTQWQTVTNSGANPIPGPGSTTPAGTAPHADSRDMGFDFDGNLLEADDGGLY